VAAGSEALLREQVALLTTFANQAVIAIENARLFRNLTEALEQQTATSDILRVISRSPTDVQPVFDAIAANAVRLCGALWSAVIRFDGELMHLVSLHKLSNPEGEEAVRRAFPRPPSRAGATDRAILTTTTAYVPDVREDREYQHQGRERALVHTPQDLRRSGGDRHRKRSSADRVAGADAGTQPLGRRASGARRGWPGD
jgi:hypothetical protein